jgi:dienelactone hydrolase
MRSEPRRALSFDNEKGQTFEDWRVRCRAKLTELLGLEVPAVGSVRQLRKTAYKGIDIQALVMEIDDTLSIPAYFLSPRSARVFRSAVIAIHGHLHSINDVVFDEETEHRAFALRLAQAGHVVLCPVLRGFDALADLAAQLEGYVLDYVTPGQHYSLAMDSFLRGKPMLTEHVEDLLRWEEWFTDTARVNVIDVAGLSYGGDLAFTYPAFSNRVRRIFASGTLGSFSAIYPRCYNAPAHCIPSILEWMDRSDIAGLNAPRPSMFHYGELDFPGPTNWSAAYNETVEESFKEVQSIYSAAGYAENAKLVVTEGAGHVMGIEDMLAFFAH